jgi:hypothetical protein
VDYFYTAVHIQRGLRTLKAKGLIEKVRYGDKFVYDLEGLRIQLEMYSESDPWNQRKKQFRDVVEKDTMLELT